MTNAANSKSNPVSTGAVNLPIGLDRTQEAYEARYADSSTLYVLQVRFYRGCDEWSEWETLSEGPMAEGRCRWLADTRSRAGRQQYRAVSMSKPEFTTAAQENIEETGANVELDLRELRAGVTTPERLLAACLAGADQDRAEGWRDYVAALVTAA